MLNEKLIPTDSINLFVGKDNRENSGFKKIEETLYIYKYPLDIYLSLETPKDESDIKNDDDSVIRFIEIRQLLRNILQGKFEIGYFLFYKPKELEGYTPYLDKIRNFALECFKIRPYEHFLTLIDIKMNIIKSLNNILIPTSLILSIIRDMLITERLMKTVDFSTNIIELKKHTKIEQKINEIIDMNINEEKIGQSKWLGIKFMIQEYQDKLRHLSKKRNIFDYKNLIKKGNILFRTIIS